MATNKSNVSKAANAPAAEAAQNDSAVAAGQSASGATGTHGSEAVEGRRGDTYTVKDGDSLESVAEEHGMTPAELVELNPELGGNNNLMYSGQTVRLK